VETSAICVEAGLSSATPESIRFNNKNEIKTNPYKGKQVPTASHTSANVSRLEHNGSPVRIDKQASIDVPEHVMPASTIHAKQLVEMKRSKRVGVLDSNEWY